MIMLPKRMIYALGEKEMSDFTVCDFRAPYSFYFTEVKLPGEVGDDCVCADPRISYISTLVLSSLS